ncbi:MAG TPA: adenylosuccinate lyase [Candidatus Hydrogenedentes bacterium]|jgi:adenylosuccinate lyase|nr:adenylosuccinate lyase [Candidatus Hydrogenedentota bacterium]MDY0033592.1 adenylosuccinate lyase [FCB group bacterium]NLT59993.1 adenylosuccinate lyase [Candidatus Hydrogenedentota bacterium]HNZ17799.1 adenylosuccinate lyase [Candidatus Hydrogenedentota bacterium]HOH34470.1 adenylosuccinate lyase [Candidatus Hydrogenedentota bacterium]
MTDTYASPLVERVATKDMIALWSPQKKFSTWRRCWVALAEAEQELGLPITDEQLDEMRAHVDDIDFEAARKFEEELRHDVMAHIHAYGAVAPRAKPIIHLGATSCYVGDNTDLILIREGLELLLGKAVNVLSRLAEFARKWRDLPTLGYTHYQPAQVVTLGKRACLWAQDILMDVEALEQVLGNLRCRGVKGTTGTQASFLALFDGDSEKVRQLDRRVAEKLGFRQSYPVTGQTYPRKVDTQVLSVLAGIGESVHKFATDMRLLQNLKEIEEPFGEKQVGSSAMAYKRNPMRCERACALARFLMVSPLHGSFTTAVQWFERTLDDSAIRRLSLPEAFLACDGILNLYLSVMENPAVYPKVIERRLKSELPFMATENILMACVKRGGDRQEVHEVIRRHAQAAAARVKLEGADNDLLDRLAADPAIGMTRAEIDEALDVRQFVGRAPQQVDEFLREDVTPILDRHRDRLGAASDVRV